MFRTVQKYLKNLPKEKDFLASSCIAERPTRVSQSTSRDCFRTYLICSQLNLPFLTILSCYVNISLMLFFCWFTVCAITFNSLPLLHLTSHKPSVKIGEKKLKS